MALDTDGLPSALEVLTKSAGTIFSVSVRFECPGVVRVPDPDTATHLYRIAQELISNAARHARPSHIRVKLHEEPAGRLMLDVDNDGVPFDPAMAAGHGMGLHFLRSRAEAIGATLEFVPGASPRGGTRVRCMLGMAPESIAP